MISSNDVYFSPITIDDDLPSSAPNLPDSVASQNFLDDFLMEMNLLDPDDTDIPPLESIEIDDLLNGCIEGFHQAQTEIFKGGLLNSLGQSTLSSDASRIHQSKATETIQTNSGLVKTSGLQTHPNLISSPSLCETGESLKLRTSPYPYQRARYERELKRDLRYISTPGNNCIDFEMLELRNRISMNTSVIMRISRTTTPYGPEGTVFCHPYPLWVKDEHAKVHHGSLLIDITDQIMNTQPIKFEHLIMLRLKQVPLKGITQWPIYTSNQLDCNGFYSLDTNKPKTIIENYNLRYSVLRFQIFLVDENQMTYPTDLSCETTSILEYEDKDRQDLPASFALERKRENKRPQTSNTTRREKATKHWHRVPRENPDGLHPHSNR